VPKEVTFKTKPAIALEQLRWACAAGLPRGVALMDAGYGTDTDLRTNITALGLSYVAGIQPQTSVWAPGTGPQPPKTWSGWGRPPKLLRRDGKHQPVSVELAFGLPRVGTEGAPLYHCIRGLPPLISFIILASFC
jgi:SRSO17 transposase